MEPLEDNTRPKSKAPDRVSLGKDEVERIDKWLSQINDYSSGFLELNRSDVVNFLIRIHNDEFSSKELQRIRKDNYDPLKHIAWIAPQIKAAISANDAERVALLERELRAVQLTASREKVAGDMVETARRTTGVPRKRNKKSPPERQLSSDSNENSLQSEES